MNLSCLQVWWPFHSLIMLSDTSSVQAIKCNQNAFMFMNRHWTDWLLLDRRYKLWKNDQTRSLFQTCAMPQWSLNSLNYTTKENNGTISIKLNQIDLKCLPYVLIWTDTICTFGAVVLGGESSISLRLANTLHTDIKNLLPYNISQNSHWILLFFCNKSQSGKVM